MSRKIILFSAPVKFMKKDDFSPPKGFEIVFFNIRNLRDFNDLSEKNNVVAWLVNPCPEFFIDESVLKKLPNIKLIVTPSTGKSHLDQDYCLENDIEIRGLLDSHVVKSITASSEFTFLLCLAAVRKLNLAVESVSNGFWRDREEDLRGREISELSIGIIGFGRIGQNLSRYFTSMNSKIYAYDPFLKDLDHIPENIEFIKDQKYLLKISDLVITSVTLNESTFKMVNEEFFRNMKKGAIYVNTSRGDVVDEDALLNALETKKISYCSLDVISGENSEDFLQNNKLVKYSKKYKNLIITPHMAGLTIDSETKAQKAAFEMLKEALFCR